MTEIAITQADTDAADQFIRSCDLSTLERYEQHTAEAFARHRHEARAAALEEAITIAHNHADMNAGSDDPFIQGAEQACHSIASHLEEVRSLTKGEKA